MKVTVAFLLVGLCMDVCWSQTAGTSNTGIGNNLITTARGTGSTNSAVTASTANSSTTITTTTVSTIITTSNNSNNTSTTSKSRGSNHACMPPFLAFLCVVGFLLF